MTIFFEEKKRFSASALWDSQRDYYHRAGIDAWTTDVPFYITSNPFIAHSYACLVLRFIQDFLRKKSSAINQPFYCVELGAGPGQFSYYFLKSFSEMQSRLALSDLKLRYIMSDFAEKNIDFWRQHDRLRTYVDMGCLDFACLDLEEDTEIYLTQCGLSLTSSSLSTPLVVIANYIFDSLPSDIFTIRNNQLYESLVSLKTGKKNLNSQGLPKDWEKIEFAYSEVASHQPYSDPDYNTVLESYRCALDSTHFLFPIAALQALKKLDAMASHQMIVLSSDKAYTTQQEQEALDYPELVFHGSFSVMANFDVIARVLKSKHGDAFLQTPREGITTAVFASGFQFSELPEMSLALNSYVESFSAGDYFLLHDRMCCSRKSFSLAECAAALALSRWDPYVYDLLVDNIVALLDDADETTLGYLSCNMSKISENFYFVPGVEDTLFNIGLFFHESEQYEKALPYYQQSLSLFGEQNEAIYNLAICYHELQNLDEALHLFKRSLALEPKQKDVKAWIKSIEKERQRHP